MRFESQPHVISERNYGCEIQSASCTLWDRAAARLTVSERSEYLAWGGELAVLEYFMPLLGHRAQKCIRNSQKCILNGVASKKCAHTSTQELGEGPRARQRETESNRVRHQEAVWNGCVEYRVGSTTHHEASWV